MSHARLSRICGELSALLESYGETEWRKALEGFPEHLEAGDAAERARSILKLYGGIGSLNDLVLSKEGRVDAEANVRLDALRSSLYEAASELLEAHDAAHESML